MLDARDSFQQEDGSEASNDAEATKSKCAAVGVSWDRPNGFDELENSLWGSSPGGEPKEMRGRLEPVGK